MQRNFGCTRRELKGTRSRKPGNTYLSQDLVALDADEMPLFIKMLAGQLAPLEEFLRDTTSNLHDRFEHLIVAVTREKDLSGI